jgi:hypothetical protein
VRGRLLRALRAAERVGYDRSAQSLDLGQHRQHEVDQGLGHDPVGFLPDPSHDVLYKAGPFKSFTATFRSETPYKTSGGTSAASVSTSTSPPSASGPERNTSTKP